MLMTLKINDMAACSQVSQGTVREYTNCDMLHLAYQDPDSSYRFYDPRSIPQMYLYKFLWGMGFSLSQIKEMGQNRTPAATVERFGAFSAQLQEKITLYQAQLDMLRSFISLIEQGMTAVPGEISLRTLPALPVRLSPIAGRGDKQKQAQRLCRAHEAIRSSGNPGCPMGYAYAGFADLFDRSQLPAQLVSYDPHGPDARPAGEYLVGADTCFYAEDNGLPRRMAVHARQNGLELCGPVYTVYLFDAACVAAPEQYLLQIAAEVRRREA